MNIARSPNLLAAALGGALAFTTNITRTGIVMLEYRYEVPFKFTGKINKLTFKLEPEPKAAPELGTLAALEPDPIDTSKR